MQQNPTVLSSVKRVAFMAADSTLMVNFRKTDADGRPYVDVPVSAATLTYFMKEYAKDGEGFVHARLNGPLGGLMRLVVEKQPYRQSVLKKKIEGKKLRLILPQSLKHAMIREEVLVAMGEHFESLLRQKFISFVYGASCTGSSVNFAVERFLALYEISTDDWSADTARKCYRDWLPAK